VHEPSSFAVQAHGTTARRSIDGPGSAAGCHPRARAGDLSGSMVTHETLDSHVSFYFRLP
jgi:hypothetical protein